jgi:uncharacterized repeat protein (TIGR03803 family)
LAIAFALTIVASPAAQAQAFAVIHTFTGGGDGAYPASGLTIDRAGNLYGTTEGGGANNLGTVFKLKYSGSRWILTPLYSFVGGNDGANPFDGVTLVQDGTLYGTTAYGGGSSGCQGYPGCGTVFHLKPLPSAPKSALAPWNETVIYRFTGGSDGGIPTGDLIFDQSGNIYGTAAGGGDLSCGPPPGGCGVIYELIPSGSAWTETVLYSPQNSSDGYDPFGGVVFDSSGNLYGTFFYGGLYGNGAVYQLSPSGSGWTHQTLHDFTGGSDGALPVGGLIIDQSGNLYGTTELGGSGGGGTVFQLMPGSGGWTFNTLYTFSGSGPGPQDKLFLNAAGNLYGTTAGDGAYRGGSVFKLTPSNGGWSYTSLHDFCAGYPCSDGYYPSSNVVFDANGNLYGTTNYGGTYDDGVVFEVTP